MAGFFFSWGIATTGWRVAFYLALNVVTFIGAGSTTEALRSLSHSSSAAGFAHHNCCFCDTAAVFHPAAAGTLATISKTNETARFDHAAFVDHPGTVVTTATPMDTQRSPAQS